MAARKLQTEIDRTLKRVKEGVEEFESLYEKLQSSQNQTQKEKMESDLKTMIKKLQRLRDQIKTWLQSNEIKDKKALMDNRRLIETQMERFKAVEKEMKTKAFSKEGLIQAAQMNPEQRAKAEVTNWISSQVDELARQVEAAEAELEMLSSSVKKGKKGGSGPGGKDERVGQLDTLNERRNWHVSRLEILLRLVENGQVDADRVSDIKDDIAYFVESNGEEEFEEDDGIYDEFHLDEEEEKFGLKDNDDINSSHDSMSVTDDQPRSIKRRDSEDMGSGGGVLKTLTEASKKANSAAVPGGTPTKKGSVSSVGGAPGSGKAEKEPLETKAIPTANFNNKTAPPNNPGAGPESPSGLTSPSKPSPAPAALPPIRYAAAAAAAVAPVAAAAASAAQQAQALSPAQVLPSAIPASPIAIGNAALPSVAPQQQAEEQLTGPGAVATADDARVSPVPALGAVESPVGGASAAPGGPVAPAAVSATGTGSGSGVTSSPAPTHSAISNLTNGAGSSTSSPSLAHRSATSLSQASPSPSHASAAVAAAGGAAGPPPGIMQLPSSAEQAETVPPGQLAASSAAAAAVQPAGGGAGTLAQQQAAQRRQGTEGARLPSSLSDLVSSFESAKQKSLLGENNLAQVHKSLEASFMNVPEPMDTEKPKYYVPKNAYPTPPYYPQQPAAVFDNQALYSKLDVDTLFYIFYYQQGTYHQYLAARELKRQSWRFHKQYLTWFQRHSEPHAITDEYEQGVYVYFDWEGSWCQRKKSDFRFEYRWLEEN